MYNSTAEVLQLLIVQDFETGRSRGFGFVVMRTLKDAERVIAATPHTIDGKVVYEMHTVFTKGSATLNFY